MSTINKTQTFVLTKEGKLPANSKMECEKYGIYAFLVDANVIRFGESASGFIRIQKGFNHQLYRRNGKKNYHAYHFREKLAQRRIEIRYYANNDLLTSANERRSIEAELAYQFRTITGAWPSEMVEIHFSNNIAPASQHFINTILDDLSLTPSIHVT